MTNKVVHGSPNRAARGYRTDPGLVTELLVLPNGKLLAHNLTPTFAEFLARLDFHDAHGRLRARAAPPGHRPVPADPETTDPHA